MKEWQKKEKRMKTLKEKVRKVDQTDKRKYERMKLKFKANN